MVTSARSSSPSFPLIPPCPSTRTYHEQKSSRLRLYLPKLSVFYVRNADLSPVHVRLGKRTRLRLAFGAASSAISFFGRHPSSSTLRGINLSELNLEYFSSNGQREFKETARFCQASFVSYFVLYRSAFRINKSSRRNKNVADRLALCDAWNMLFQLGQCCRSLDQQT